MAEVARRRGVKIFRSQEAVDLVDTDLIVPGPMSETVQKNVEDYVANGALAGAQYKVLARQPADEGGFSLVFIWLKPHYPIPRHNHSEDCMYYIISGTLLMGSQTLKGGDALYIPAGAPYAYDAGPGGAEILEIRRGAWQADINYLDADRPDQWKAMMATLATHRDRWEAMEVSPTLADA